MMSKPWRMVALHIGAWITLAVPATRFTTLTTLDWTCFLIIAGCVQTIAVASSASCAQLRAKSAAR
jgi:hypothetical protein